MGYSNITSIEYIVAQALTSAAPRSSGEPEDLLKIGNTFDSNIISSEIVDQYIKWADSEINSALSELYITPLCEKSDFETTLLSNIDDYNDYIITEKSCPFYPGDNLILTDGDNEERVIIESIVDDIDTNVFTTTEPISYAFVATETRLIRVRYPDPIPLVSARMAGASIYEKYFMSQASPSESEYGGLMRKLAKRDLNNILNGRTILHGQIRIGRRFYNSNVVDRYGLPYVQPGDNNMDEV